MCKYFGNPLFIVVLLICWLLVVLTFFILATQLFITIIGFKLTALAGFVLVPFALWNKTSFLAERVLGNVVSSGIKIMVLAVVIGIGTNLFGQITAILGARAAMATGRGGLTAVRASTAMGAAASAAYQLGQMTVGSATVGIGLGGMANAARWSAAQGVCVAASRVAAPFRESMERGWQAAWNVGSPGAIRVRRAAAITATGTASSAPEWAQRLRAEEAARYRRHDERRGGSGAGACAGQALRTRPCHEHDHHH